MAQPEPMVVALRVAPLAPAAGWTAAVDGVRAAIAPAVAHLDLGSALSQEAPEGWTLVLPEADRSHQWRSVCCVALLGLALSRFVPDVVIEVVDPTKMLDAALDLGRALHLRAGQATRPRRGSAPVPAADATARLLAVLEGSLGAETLARFGLEAPPEEDAPSVAAPAPSPPPARARPRPAPEATRPAGLSAELSVAPLGPDDPAPALTLTLHNATGAALHAVEATRILVGAGDMVLGAEVSALQPLGVDAALSVSLPLPSAGDAASQVRVQARAETVTIQHGTAEVAWEDA